MGPPEGQEKGTGVASGKMQRMSKLKKPERKGPAPTASGTSRPILPGPWQTNAFLFLLLIIASTAFYGGDLQLGFFTVDDPSYVVNNPWIRGVSAENLRHILGTPYFANYSPVHLLSYLLDYVLGGLNPFAYHLSSNIWAGVGTGFVFLVALALTGRRAVAMAAGALFLLHPAHVEAIAWISSRKDLVAVVFALPSLIAYLYYRRGGASAARWYAASLVLFVLAVAGKLSVATLPAVFLAYDVVAKKRPLIRSLADKIPFLAAAGSIALVVASAQPPVGQGADAYVLLSSLVQNLWLLSGFGTYVIYRAPPVPPAGMAVAAAALLLAVFAAPLLLRRRAPMIAVLVYWILFALIPSQVLSFAYPVSDRYLFFPSVAAVILLAWGIVAAGERLGRRGVAAAWALLLVIAFMWGWGTLTYLAEWRDPRSVWYAATGKSSDPNVYYNLGLRYLDGAARLGAAPRKTALPQAEARSLASLVWADDPRLPSLFAEWSGGQRGGPIEKLYQDRLWTLSWDAIDRALLTRGRHIMPDLYFHRGLILQDRGDLNGARKEFLTAIDEASHFRFAEGREVVLVNSHYNLGVAAWTSGDYREALRWLRLAEEEQTRFGGSWISDLTASRKRLESIIASLPAR